VPDLQITMANHISSSAAQSALSIQELVTTMKTAGMADSAIRQTLLNDLNTGGPLFGSFRNKLKNTVKNGVESSSNVSANGKFTKAGVKQFQWVSVGDGKVCPDCEERHGETGTMEYFETIGLPASGFSVCTTNCRCQLLPENYKGENLDKPLVKGEKPIISRPIGKAKTIKEANEAGLGLIDDIAIKYDRDAKSINFKGIPVSFANAISESLEKMVKETGVKINEIKVIGNGALQINPTTTTFFKNGVPIATEQILELQIGKRWIKELGHVNMLEFSTKMIDDFFANSLDDLIRHEYGHVLTSKKMLDMGTKEIKTDFSKISKSLLSKYGKSSGEEALAEIYLFYKQKGKSNMPKDWIDFFNKYSEQKI